MSLAAGFFGKIPTRGDFVRGGLPSDFVGALDDWWQVVLPGSRAAMGERWTDAWMEAAVWRFALPPGCCGAGAAVGLWVPSTDRAGRLFPLTLAAVAPGWTELAAQGSFLDAAEEIGITAVEQDVTPDQLAAAVTRAAAGPAVALPEPAVPTWWTTGTLAGPTRFTCPSMPSVEQFVAMLGD